MVGASGYGKTVLLLHIIKQRIEQKKGLMFIDLKGDMETLLKFSKLVIDADRADDLQIFSITEKQMSLPYNLIEDGTATQLRDRIMSSLNWSEEYYKNQSASYLLKLLIAELISGMAGTRTVWKNTRQTERMFFVEVDSGNGTKREAEEFVIHPNLIKTLQVGKCVCIKKYPKSRAHLVDVSFG